MLELELASLLMASQPPQTDLSLAEFDSFIRGFHVYKDVWTPVVGEMLAILLKRSLLMLSTTVLWEYIKRVN